MTARWSEEFSFRANQSGHVLRLVFAGYVPLAFQSPYPIIVYSVASYIDPILVTFRQICNFRYPNLVTFYFCELTHCLNWMKNTSPFTYSANILVVANRKCEELSHPRKSENVRPHSSDSIENATHPAAHILISLLLGGTPPGGEANHCCYIMNANT